MTPKPWPPCQHALWGAPWGFCLLLDTGPTTAGAGPLAVRPVLAQEGVCLTAVSWSLGSAHAATHQGMKQPPSSLFLAPLNPHHCGLYLLTESPLRGPLDHPASLVAHACASRTVCILPPAPKLLSISGESCSMQVVTAVNSWLLPGPSKWPRDVSQFLA